MTSRATKFSSLPAREKAIVVFITGLAVLVRLYKIWQPSSVVFDEVHFGGFATKYFKGRYFMDVHPPLAKLLITLAGFLAGFDGSFDFKDIGLDYNEAGVPYVAMRLLPATLGVLVVPLAYLTLKAYGCSSVSASLGSIFILFENALTTQSRFILLDSPLVFFTALTAYAWTNFQNQVAFDRSWYYYLFLTGLSLGATASVKWVGLFTIAWVGITTIIGLWNILGDIKVSLPSFIKHFILRAVFLIVVPVIFYLAMFAIHFVCLVNPGDGDGFMSSEFQATLNNKKLADTPADVVLGSHVTIRHLNTQGGYLHSHDHLYPTGSKQQQVTLYPHKDENNVWLLDNVTGSDTDYRAVTEPGQQPIFLKHGDIIRLQHVVTHRRLHSHDVRPPVTEAEWQNEVSAYGHEGFTGDMNDHFRVEILESKSKPGRAVDYVRAIDTKFRLIHQMSGCALFSHKIKLPSWGYEQQEVTCAKQGTLPNSIWYIESNDHPLLGPDSEKVNYPTMGFLQKFAELQKVMWDTNAGLIASHAWDSRPQAWPYLRRGINFWVKDHRQVYLIGNIFIWWLSTASLAAYVIWVVAAVLRWQRGYQDFVKPAVQSYGAKVGTNVLAWALHFLPFFLMQRQLFLHHYLPALYFAILALTITWDAACKAVLASNPGSKSRRVFVLAATVALAGAAVYVFVNFTPLIYGDKWTSSSCENHKWLKNWDFDCHTFHDNLNDYESLSAPSPSQLISEVVEAGSSATEHVVRDEL
ncbi:Dolichyl-phosphate-mannose-protein mannosyltransferase-domain-containing protein [Lipomyces japonicus]|uniref:Dolichyl-phosphate-mannose-protein mannosyltransferase-domain-containing protein n=1 Tax=Lipomyces japonicus TaxID=56871 RepID=UPI0034CF5A3C